MIFVVSYRADAVREFVGHEFADTIRADFVTQPTARGTGDALRHAAKHALSDPFLLGYGDVFFRHPDVMLDRLIETPSPKIVAMQVPDTSPFGTIVAEGAGLMRFLKEIREKEGKHVPGLVNAGWYLLPRSLLPILDSLSPSPRGEIELTDALTRFVKGGGRIEVVVIDGCLDIGTPENLAAANAFVTDSPG
jgi:dTDP-glucose pyrophosphorylase